MKLQATTLLRELRAANQAFAEALEWVERVDAWDAERRMHIALESLNAVTDMSVRLAQLSVGSATASAWHVYWVPMMTSCFLMNRPTTWIAVDWVSHGADF